MNAASTTVPLAALDGARLVLVCGSGGVGKTTTSAALGMAYARTGKRVLVMTVDPARRLAQALGIAGITHAETVVDVADASGTLTITMLDTKQGWDDLVRRYAPDRAAADRVLANPLYENITERFVHSHDYMAMEQLYLSSHDERFDVVIVDTPPSRRALDVFDAPRRMREFFSGRLIKWLTLPYRSRALTLASRPFLQIADRLLGARFLTDIAEFFTLMQSMERGFVSRARAVEDTLRDPSTACVVVTSAEPASVDEATFLVHELPRRGFRPGLVVVNRVIVEMHSADEPPMQDGTVVDDELAVFVQAAVDRHLRAAQRHRDSVNALRSMGVPLVTVPDARGAESTSGLNEVLAAVEMES